VEMQVDEDEVEVEDVDEDEDEDVDEDEDEDEDENENEDEDEDEVPVQVQEDLPDYSTSSQYPTGSFKCDFHNCNAPPFQTQYLLNSHTNVHSNTRPHFCPFEACPRGPGGEGFKRKNEMIRHGLVHTSPGYTCPFCPDQRRKYPRPDNLQRHVKAQHMDRGRDDPQLREVLNQRTPGGGPSRGRRRRIGPGQ